MTQSTPAMKRLVLGSAIGTLLTGALVAYGLVPLQAESGVVAGKILTTAGSPAVLVAVVALDASRAIGGTTAGSHAVRAAETDSSGSYRLHLPPGRYYIIAGAIESPTYYPGVPFEAGATVVGIAAGATVNGVDFPVSTRSTGVTVSGRVILDPRQPAVSAPRSIVIGRAAAVIQERMIARDGSFTFTKVPPGPYSLRLMPSPTDSIQAVPNMSRGSRYTINVGDTDVRDLELTAPLTVTIRGKIRVEGSAWRDGFSFWSDRLGSGLTLTAIPPNHDGTFTLTLYEGHYRTGVGTLPLTSDGREMYRVKTSKYGSVDLLQEPLDVPGASAATLVVELERVTPPDRTVSNPRMPPFTPASIVANPANGIGMEFVNVEPGTFQMGCSEGDVECSDNEKPSHMVRLTKGFEIGKYEVTQSQWQAVMGNNPSHFIGGSLPVEQVEWPEVVDFLTKMNARNDGYLYRLPTEAEWEYAARAGSRAPYMETMGWHQDNSGGQTHPVGEKPPNIWGLYDIDGNVREWVKDRPSFYAPAAATDPPGDRDGARLVRGGAWDSAARDLRVSYRGFSSPAFKTADIGFRCVRELVR
jgi:formylglycine-generating enzyme required for sulfatase activity